MSKASRVPIILAVVMAVCGLVAYCFALIYEDIVWMFLALWFEILWLGTLVIRVWERVEEGGRSNG